MAWNMAKTFAKLIVLLRIYVCDVIEILCRLGNCPVLGGAKKGFVCCSAPPTTHRHSRAGGNPSLPSHLML
jgi:hypothetical protein